MPSKFLAQMADFLGHLRKWGWVEDGEFSLAENAFKICVFLLCTSGETLGNVDLGFRIWKSSGNRGDLKAKRAMLLFI